MVSWGSEKPAYYLLDTNILLAYIRAGKVGKYVEKTYQLRGSGYKPMISVVSIGEIRALAKKLDWEDKKLDYMDKLLRELVRIDISNEQILDTYAELDHFCEKTCKPAEPIGKNDLWIAATAAVTQATLLSTDKHFKKFVSRFLKYIYIDQDAIHQE